MDFNVLHISNSFKRICYVISKTWRQEDVDQ